MLLLEPSCAKGVGLRAEGTLGVGRRRLEVLLAFGSGGPFEGSTLVRVCNHPRGIGPLQVEGVAGGLDLGELRAEVGFASRQAFDVGSGRLVGCVRRPRISAPTTTVPRTDGLAFAQPVGISIEMGRAP
jgi:hypothetical protein